MENNIKWNDAAMELCRRLAKFEYLADKKKNVLTYVPNGIETREIDIRAAAIFTDITKRYRQDNDD